MGCDVGADEPLLCMGALTGSHVAIVAWPGKQLSTAGHVESPCNWLTGPGPPALKEGCLGCR